MGLAAMMAPLEVTPGQELCLPGDAAGAVWLLLEGDGYCMLTYLLWGSFIYQSAWMHPFVPLERSRAQN